MENQTKLNKSTPKKSSNFTVPNKNKSAPKKKMSKKTKIILIVVIAVIVLVGLVIALLGLGIYKFSWEKAGGIRNKIAAAAIENLPFPIAAVNIKNYDWKDPQGIFAFRFISIQEWENNVNALKKYYEKEGVDFKTEQGEEQLNSIKKAILEKMIMDRIVADLASQEGIKITDADIKAELDKASQALGGSEEIEKMVKEMYGWDMENFKEKIIIPYLRQTKLLDKIYNKEEENADAKKKAQEVLAKVKSSDANFEELAKQYSEDPFTASEGGDLGTFGRGVMVPAFEEAAFALERGEISDIVETPYGYHIIKMEDRGKLDTGEEQIRVRHILILTQDPNEWFGKWLEEQKKDTKILKFTDLE